MKRIGLKLALSALIVLMSTAFCFAGTFTVLETTPVDGQKETSIDNLCVKMYFDKDTSFENTIKTQKDLFKVVGEDGKYVPLKVLYDKKEHVILALAYDDKTNNSSKIVSEDTDYKFTVSNKLVDDKGNTFEVAKENMDQDGNFTITFRTQNQKRAMRVNFLMMLVMFGGIMVFSSRAMKKQQKEEQEAKQKKTKVNPYEEAKRTGKSVEEIIAREEKIKAKEEAKRKKREEERAKQEAEELEALRATYYKVSKPRPISEAGSKFVSGKKPKAPSKKKK